MNKPRRNPQAPDPFEAASDLYEQLRSVGGVFFTLDEVTAFADYCMRALQSCPESARFRVTAEWSRKRTLANNRLYEQKLFLVRGALNASKEMLDSPGYNTYDRARIALGKDLQERLPDDDNVLAAFMGNVAEVLVTPFWSNKNYSAFADMTTYDDLMAWLRAHQRSDHFPFGTLRSNRYHTFTTETTSGKYTEIYLDDGRTVDAGQVMQLANKITDEMALADELQSTGAWEPDPTSYELFENMCGWVYVRDRHAAET